MSERNRLLAVRKDVALLTAVVFFSTCCGSVTAFLTSPTKHAFLPSHVSQRNRYYENHLWMTKSVDANEDEEEDEKEKGDKKKTSRKRDRLKGWMKSSSEPMVQPIRMEDGSVVEPPPQEPPRIKAKFDNLFAGMPTLSEIVGAEETDISDQRPKATKKAVDDSWFDAEKQEIEQNYNLILQDMLQQLEDERQQDPEAVPDNAQALVQSVLKQEMDAEIAAKKEQRATELLRQYEEQQQLALRESDDLQEPNESVQKLIDESEAEYAQQEASRSELEAFLRYEQEAFARAADEVVVAPQEGEDLDRWALDRLEDMAQEQIDVDGGEAVLDNLEQNVDDLREGIEKEGARKSSRPDSLKEWQMYRSIATSFTDGVQSQEADFEEQIAEQLESWKGYVEKEEGIRKESGLTRGPKLPFDWQEFDLDEPPLEGVETNQFENLDKIESRKQVNRMSIEALESLLERSDDQRKEKLQKEIDYLKATLEANDYLDVDESFLLQDEEPAGPVDMSGVFQTSSVEEEKNLATSGPDETPSAMDAREVPPTTPFFSAPDEQVEQVPPPATPFLSDGDKTEEVAPPDTPFFSEDETTEKAAPPSTPFFSDDVEEDVGVETAGLGGKLGSMEDQKLEAMFRRAGARTTEERNAIRAQWEDFQNIEKQKREMSGLSGDDDEELLAQTDVKYNVSEVMKGDGDFDADKILATIGPRPVRKKKSSISADTSQTTSPEITTDDSQADTSMESSVDKEEVMDSLYRSVSAIGGGRFRDDPEGDSKQKASFEEFMRKENELRESLDVLEENEVPGETIEDDVEYAEEVLSSLGPRPKPKRTRIIDEGDYSDKGGVLASEDEEDGDDTAEDLDSAIESDGQLAAESNTEDDDGLTPEMPEWLRRENEEARAGRTKRKTFLGSEIDEMFDDTDYDKNMRQLAEYERRRAGKERQMGIDISDVLGRSAFESDDYADYKFDTDYQRGRQENWGAASFDSRKANFLEYTELEIVELNSLMDHKDSVYATGVSQYMPRINKPFKEFGAVFRLEGILVDVTGLQMKAWTKVAEKYGFKLPSIDEVRRASVTRPDIAVKDCFFWTDNFLQCRQVAASHREAFREEFDGWMQEIGFEPEEAADPFPTKGGMAIGSEVLEAVPPFQRREEPRSEDETLRLTTAAWAKTAEKYAQKAPVADVILNAVLVSPEIAVLRLFRWTADPREADIIASDFRQFLSLEKGHEGDAKQDSRMSESTPVPAKPFSQNDAMELHYQAWLEVARTFDFEEPTADEAIAAFVINDPLIAIRDGYAWTTDPTLLAQAVQKFQEVLAEVMPGSTVSSAPSNEILMPEERPETAKPGQDDVFKSALDSWSAVADRFGLPPPDYEQVQFALTVGPEEAVATGFQWTDDGDKTNEIVWSYREELAKRRGESRPGPAVTPTQPANTQPDGPSQDEIYQAVFDAWSATAIKRGCEVPDAEQIQFALSVGPEEAVVTGFQWTDNLEEVSQIVEAYKEELGKRRSQWYQNGSNQATSTQEESVDAVAAVHVMPGAAKWIKSLLDVEMQCAVISHLDRNQVDVLIEHAGLDNLFGKDKRVSASNGYNRESQQMLGAALRLERRPDHCVVFDTTPYASAAAHEMDMRSVNLIGPFPRYELLSSDTTTSSFEDLTAINIRRLFGERVYDQPMLDTQQTEPEPTRKTKTKYFWDDD